MWLDRWGRVSMERVSLLSTREGLDLPGRARSGLGARGRHGGVSMATITPVVSQRQTGTAPMGKREDVEKGA